MVIHVPFCAKVKSCFLPGAVVCDNVADVGGWSRSQTDQFLKTEMMDELDDDHSVISAGCLPVSLCYCTA